MNRSRAVGWVAMLCAGLLPGLVDAAAVDDPARVARAAQIVAQASRPDEPGCAIGAYRSGRALLHTAFGLADLTDRKALTPQSVFGAASISKQFTAAAAAIAAEQGYFSLDDDIRKILTELPDYGHKVAVRDLIHHVSGLRDFNHLVKLTFKPDLYRDKPAILKLIARQQRLNFVPRTEFSYNNSGYLLLAEIVERATGRSLQAFAADNIFKPLGMTHTYFAHGAPPDVLRAQPYSKTAAGWQPTAQENLITPGPGGLMTTVDDYQRWAANLIAAQSLLPGGKALQSRLRETALLADGSRTDYAFGLETAPYKGNETLSHGGSGLGYKTYAMIFPKRALVVVGLCNNGAYADSLVMAVADALLGIPATVDSSNSVTTQRSSMSDLARFVGFYRDPQLALPRIVSVRDGALHMVGDVIEHTLRRVAANRFEASGVKGEFEFAAPPDGSAVSPGFRQLHPSLSSGTSRFERIEVAQPSAARLQGYVGRYYSAELDTLYEVSVAEGRLTMRGGRDRPSIQTPAISLEPMLEDEFVSLEHRFIARFVRDRQQGIRGFKASAQFGWVRDIEFTRVEDDAKQNGAD
ncbi:serine hydrolase domain-containing protein [Peristeroidobacter soli]|uniref:serine hydrolase domain-containing protein n=1 Tax=Peristeroidobacter soli TaxID=2497877 RepID=UPI0013002811|nr:serine hydrolase domain-containing protein [Peristeroidobacter soli]